MSSSKEQIEKKFQLSKSRKSESVTPMKSLPPVKRSCVNNVNKSVVYQNKSFDAKKSYMVNRSYDNINMSEEKVTNIKAMKIKKFTEINYKDKIFRRKDNIEELFEEIYKMNFTLRKLNHEEQSNANVLMGLVGDKEIDSDMMICYANSKRNDTKGEEVLSKMNYIINNTIVDKEKRAKTARKTKNNKNPYQVKNKSPTTKKSNIIINVSNIINHHINNNNKINLHTSPSNSHRPTNNIKVDLSHRLNEVSSNAKPKQTKNDANRDKLMKLKKIKMQLSRLKQTSYDNSNEDMKKSSSNESSGYSNKTPTSKKALYSVIDSYINNNNN